MQSQASHKPAPTRAQTRQTCNMLQTSWANPRVSPCSLAFARKNVLGVNFEVRLQVAGCHPIWPAQGFKSPIITPAAHSRCLRCLMCVWEPLTRDWGDTTTTGENENFTRFKSWLFATSRSPRNAEPMKPSCAEEIPLIAPSFLGLIREIAPGGSMFLHR